jgi:TonB family protein
MVKNYYKIIIFEIGSALFFMGFGTLILVFSLITEKSLSELYQKERMFDSDYNREFKTGLSQTSVLPGDEYRITLETDIHDDKAGDMDSIIQKLTRLQAAGPIDSRTHLARDIGREENNADINDLSTRRTEASLRYKASGKKTVATPRIAVDVSERENVRSEEIALVITSHNDAIEHCYKIESNINPNLKGEALVAFTISHNGRVKELRMVKSTLRNKKVENCIISRIKGWRFQPLDIKEGDITVTQKYIFN